MSTVIDFEEDWGDVSSSAKRPPLRLTKRGDVLAALEDACEKAGKDLRADFSEFTGQQLTPEMLSAMVSKTVTLFMTHWVKSLQDYNLAGLIEIILDGQGLDPAEMKAFIRAMPRSLIGKICDSEIGTWTGVHALMGVEFAYRSGRLVEDYQMGRDPGSADRVFFEFRPRTAPNPEDNGKSVRLYLDEERGEGLPAGVEGE